MKKCWASNWSSTMKVLRVEPSWKRSRRWPTPLNMSCLTQARTNWYVGHTPEQLKEAHGQVVDLIKRVEQAQSKPPMVQQMAEDALAEIGLVVAAVIDAEEVRELLHELGHEQLADCLSNQAICAQIEVLLGGRDVNDVSGVPEWKNHIAHLAAENLCKAAGVALALTI